jgi:ribose 5-phosphate isomerase B
MVKSLGHTVKDVGTYSTNPVDFPDIAQKLCDKVRAGRSQRGIMVHFRGNVQMASDIAH